MQCNVSSVSLQVISILSDVLSNVYSRAAFIAFSVPVTAEFMREWHLNEEIRYFRAL